MPPPAWPWLGQGLCEAKREWDRESSSGTPKPHTASLSLSPGAEASGEPRNPFPQASSEVMGGFSPGRGHWLHTLQRSPSPAPSVPEAPKWRCPQWRSGGGSWDDATPASVGPRTPGGSGSGDSSGLRKLARGEGRASPGPPHRTCWPSKPPLGCPSPPHPSPSPDFSARSGLPTSQGTLVNNPELDLPPVQLHQEACAAPLLSPQPLLLPATPHLGGPHQGPTPCLIDVV